MGWPVVGSEPLLISPCADAVKGWLNGAPLSFEDAVGVLVALLALRFPAAWTTPPEPLPLLAMAFQPGRSGPAAVQTMVAAPA